MSAYVCRPALPYAPPPSFAYEGIVVHPDHALVAYAEDDEMEDELPAIAELEISDPSYSKVRRDSGESDLSSSSSTSSGDVGSPYFVGYEFASSSRGGLFEDDDDSPSSSRSSTPTRDTSCDFKPRSAGALSASSNRSPPLAASSFFFASGSFSPRLGGGHAMSQPSTPLHLHRPSLAPLGTGGATMMGRSTSIGGGAMMHRSVSLPVEPAHVLRDRLSRRSSLHAAAHALSPKLGWSGPPSSAASPSSELLPPRRESAPTGLGLSVRRHSAVHLAFDERDDAPTPAPAPLSTYP